MDDTTPSSERPNRMNRRRQKTRDRLIDAALSVMAAKGADAATIADITETADVGFGSFYNHFSSKEEILAAAIETLSDRIGTEIDRAVGAITDPLALLATALRTFITILISKPEWAQFFVRIGSVPGYKDISLFHRLYRDIRAVEAAGKVQIADLQVATYAMGGALMFMVMALLEGD